MKKPTVWLVDDLLSNRQAFMRAHSKYMNVIAFESPVEVIERLRNKVRPDALLCDVYFFEGRDVKISETIVKNGIAKIRRDARNLHAEDHQDGIDLMEQIQRDFDGSPPFPVFAYTAKAPYLMENSGFARIISSGARWLFKHKNNKTAEYAIITDAIRQVTKSARKVFLVHGRNRSIRNRVEIFLDQLHLKPIVLAEQPDEGKTIIEKFELHADAGYAVILLTADDLGGLKKGTRQSSTLEAQCNEQRARQNVIFEWGFFLGRLGRHRVSVLYEEGVTLPTDAAGIVYKGLDSNEWQHPLRLDLKSAGLIF